MAISANLLPFLEKGSGVYRLLLDRSQIPSIGAATTTPLVVGFSKQGPFNIPVLCTDTDFFISVFGNTDKSLEKKGSFFHRSAIELLEVGPVICLNLFNINQEVPTETVSIDDPRYDLTEFAPISASAGKTNGPNRIKTLASFYDRNKFWLPDGEEFLGTAGADAELINLVNLGKNSLSVIVKKGSLTGFDVTAREWYGQEELPDFIDPLDYMSDYMVDVYVFKGDFTNYQKLSTDPILGKYFNKDKGFIKSKFNEFLDQPEVSIVGLYQGSLIPGFIDKLGRTLFIESLINSDTPRTGLFCAVNADLFDAPISGIVGGVDLIGHSLEGTDTGSVNFLSYKDSIASDLLYEEKQTPTEETILENVSTDPVLEISIASSNSLFVGNSAPKSPDETWAEWITENLAAGVSYIKYNGTQYTKIVAITQGLDGITLEVNNSITILGNSWELVPALDVLIDSPTGPFPEFYIATEGTQLYKDWASGILTNGDLVKNVNLLGPTPVTTTRFIKFVKQTTNLNGLIEASSLADSVRVEMYSSESLTLAGTETLADLFIPFGESFLSDATQPSAFSGLIIQTLKGSLNQKFSATEGPNTNIVYVPNASENTGKIKAGDLIVQRFADPSRLSRIVSVKEDLVNNWIEIVAQGEIEILGGYIEIYQKIEDFVDFYNFIKLHGFRLKERTLPDGTADRINEIYNTLSGGILKGLIDKEGIQFRYIIDTMTGVISPSTKNQLVRLARRRENATAICNLPSTKQLSSSLDPRFTDAPTSSIPRPSVEARYIAQGGNQQLNPTATFSLPTVQEGAAFANFYGPHLIIRERGKETLVPPAAYVAKNFILKFVQGNPWDIVAGRRRGVISGNSIVGVENNWDEEDRGFLEKWGYNPIVNERGVGLVIKSNSTAQQSVKSALSSINVIEAIIFIQDRIAERLKSYVWEFNTPQTRLEIKTLADDICESVRIDGGISAYQNVMDTSNNTNELIEREVGVLDTLLEPVFGLGVIVHRTTILRTGQIESGFVQGV